MTSWKVKMLRSYYKIYSCFNAPAVANSILGRSLLMAASLFMNVYSFVMDGEKRTWFSHKPLFSVRKLIPEAKCRNDLFSLPENVRSLKDLRMACIADEFTALSFSLECELCNLRSIDWLEQITKFQPHMLFVESTWNGKGGSWKWKVSLVSPELIELIVWCKRHAIPTIFWNKEDPKHFDTFIRTAQFFDYVFTTDGDLIPKYKERLRNDNVGLLMFAAQPAIHNPIEIYARQDGFCFAGAYYAMQLERNRAFGRMVDALQSLGPVEIFDRYQNTLDMRMVFPSKYSDLIVGSLPPEGIDRAYKFRYYGINVNTIKGSSTMMARRVFELLASNTIVVSNYSIAQSSIMGESTICTDDLGEMVRKVGIFQRDSELRDTYRLEGLREVMLKHTCRHRLRSLVDVVFKESMDLGLPTIAVISAPQNMEELEHVIECYSRQTYQFKTLWLILDERLANESKVGTVICGPEKDHFRIDRLNADMLCPFHPSDCYREDYITDLALAAWWSGADAVGKNPELVDTQGVRENGLQDYGFLDHLLWRSSIVSAKRSGIETVGQIIGNMGDGHVSLPVCLACDRFNYEANKFIC